MTLKSKLETCRTLDDVMKLIRQPHTDHQLFPGDCLEAHCNHDDDTLSAVFESTIKAFVTDWKFLSPQLQWADDRCAWVGVTHRTGVFVTPVIGVVPPNVQGS
jgi:hypothetical protein